MVATKTNSSEHRETDLTSSTGFRRILVAVDGSENARKAAEVAIDISRRYSANLFVLHVIPNSAPVMITVSAESQRIGQELVDLAKKNGEKWIHEIVAGAQEQNVKVRGEIVDNVPSVVKTILEYASEWRIDLITVGSRGLGGFRRMLLGSVSNGLVTHAPCPVLVVRMSSSREKPQFRKILVAVDGSSHAQEAVRVAVDMTKTLRADLIALNVMALPWMASSLNAPLPLDKIYNGLREVGAEVTKEAAAMAEMEEIGLKQVMKEGFGSPVQTITEYVASESIDLIVLGTRGLGGFKRLLLGSVATGVVNHAQTSVLVVR
jgi:nucleotide-binding universal stress UspA family protein